MDGRVIRSMQSVDLEAVLINERRSYTHPWNQGIFEDCLDSGHGCWVLEVEGCLIGHGIISVGAGEAHLLNVCIHPNHQGKGYGRLLVEHLISQAKDRAATSMFLEVRSSNQVAYQLYEKLGFNEVGVRQGYYPAYTGREDAFVLAIELI